jgi:hypothetical protein
VIETYGTATYPFVIATRCKLTVIIRPLEPTNLKMCLKIRSHTWLTDAPLGSSIYWTTQQKRVQLHISSVQIIWRFLSWWGKALRVVAKDWHKGLNYVVILVAWEIWKHRNSCVFEHTRPSIPGLLRKWLMSAFCGEWLELLNSRNSLPGRFP